VAAAADPVWSIWSAGGSVLVAEYLESRRIGVSVVGASVLEDMVGMAGGTVVGMVNVVLVVGIVKFVSFVIAGKICGSREALRAV
jgi:hypothetical protein